MHYFRCITRPPSPASATGIKWIYQKELQELKEKIIAGADGAEPPAATTTTNKIC